MDFRVYNSATISYNVFFFHCFHRRRFKTIFFFTYTFQRTRITFRCPVYTNRVHDHTRRVDGEDLFFYNNKGEKIYNNNNMYNVIYCIIHITLTLIALTSQIYRYAKYVPPRVVYTNVTYIRVCSSHYNIILYYCI